MSVNRPGLCENRIRGDLFPALRGRKPAGETEPAVKIAAEAPANTAPPTGSPAVEASESVPATRKGIGGFFADMGDFLLAVWPYLLIVLVPLAIVLIMKKTKK